MARKCLDGPTTLLTVVCLCVSVLCLRDIHADNLNTMNLHFVLGPPLLNASFLSTRLTNASTTSKKVTEGISETVTEFDSKTLSEIKSDTRFETVSNPAPETVPETVFETATESLLEEILFDSVSETVPNTTPLTVSEAIPSATSDSVSEAISTTKTVSEAIPTTKTVSGATPNTAPEPVWENNDITFTEKDLPDTPLYELNINNCHKENALDFSGLRGRIVGLTGEDIQKRGFVVCKWNITVPDDRYAAVVFEMEFSGDKSVSGAVADSSLSVTAPKALVRRAVYNAYDMNKFVFFGSSNRLQFRLSFPSRRPERRDDHIHFKILFQGTKLMLRDRLRIVRQTPMSGMVTPFGFDRNRNMASPANGSYLLHVPGGHYAMLSFPFFHPDEYCYETSFVQLSRVDMNGARSLIWRKCGHERILPEIYDSLAPCSVKGKGSKTALERNGKSAYENKPIANKNEINTEISEPDNNIDEPAANESGPAADKNGLPVDKKGPSVAKNRPAVNTHQPTARRDGPIPNTKNERTASTNTFSGKNVGNKSILEKGDFNTFCHHNLELLYVREGAWSQPRGFKMLYSFHPPDEKPLRTSNNAFLCSENYDSFKQHLQCNLNPECGRPFALDEMDCDSRHKGCVNNFGIAYKNSCYYVVPPAKEFDESAYRSVMLKSSGQWEAFRKLFEQGQLLYNVRVGLEPSDPRTTPDFYRALFQWQDGTVAYDVNVSYFGNLLNPASPMATINGRFPDRVFVTTDLSAGANGRFVDACEVPIFHNQTAARAEVRFPQLKRSWKDARGPRLANISLVECISGHVTRYFLSAEPASLCGTKSSSSFPEGLATFICDDGKNSLHVTLVCDFRDDCEDGSDEKYCRHDSHCEGFLCNNTQCIPASKRCNVLRDCVDGSDENGCVYSYPDYSNVLQVRISAPSIVNFDYYGDVTQKRLQADEECPESHFQCPGESNHCLPVFVRCNGVYDCAGHEDEADCQNYTCPGFYRCRASSVCVHLDHLCDGWAQCPQRDDELLCDFTCPHTCTCHGLAFVCSLSFPAENYPHLRAVDASHSGLSPLNFTSNIYLLRLRLGYCGLETLSKINLKNIIDLDLSFNKLTYFSIDSISELKNIQILNLSGNPISYVIKDIRNDVAENEVSTHVFRHDSENVISQKMNNDASSDVIRHIPDDVMIKNLSDDVGNEVSTTFIRLTTLDVSQTQVHTFNGSFYAIFPSLKYLNLSFTKLNTVTGGGFDYFPGLLALDLRGTRLGEYSSELLHGLSQLRIFLAPHYKFCCSNFLPQPFTEGFCSAPEDQISSCDYLLKSALHRLLMWSSCLISLCGNVASLVVHVRDGNRAPSTCRLFVANLSFTRLVMTVYLLETAIADQVFSGRFMAYEGGWSDSVACVTASFLWVVARVASACMVFLITLDTYRMLKWRKSGKVERSEGLDGSMLNDPLNPSTTEGASDTRFTIGNRVSESALSCERVNTTVHSTHSLSSSAVSPSSVPISPTASSSQLSSAQVSCSPTAQCTQPPCSPTEPSSRFPVSSSAQSTQVFFSPTSSTLGSCSPAVPSAQPSICFVGPSAQCSLFSTGHTTQHLFSPVEPSAQPSSSPTTLCTQTSFSPIEPSTHFPFSPTAHPTQGSFSPVEPSNHVPFSPTAQSSRPPVRPVQPSSHIAFSPTVPTSQPSVSRTEPFSQSPFIHSVHPTHLSGWHTGVKWTQNHCAILLCLAVWTCAATVSGSSLLASMSTFNIHIHNDLCFPLPSNIVNREGQNLASAVLVLFNLLLTLPSLLLQCFVNRWLRAEFSKLGLSDPSPELIFARSFNSVVIVDCLCWLPVGLSCLLLNFGIAGSDETLKVLVMCASPLSVAITPVLYLFNVVREKQRVTERKRLLAILRSRATSKQKSNSCHMR